MPLLPTDKSEDKKLKSISKSNSLNDIHLKLKFLPSVNTDDASLEFSRTKNIQFILVLHPAMFLVLSFGSASLTYF
jgi:hypothetical protein